MCVLRLISGERQTVLHIEENTRLSDAIRRAGPPFSMPCGGNQTCGKCRVTARGSLSEPTAQEKKFINEADLQNGVRLACFTVVTGDAEAALPAPSDAGGQILTQGVAEPVAPDADNPDGYGLAVDIGTTTVVVYLLSLKTGRVLQTLSDRNAQRVFGADVISRIEAANSAGVLPIHDTIIKQLNEMFKEICKKEGIGTDSVLYAVITGNTTMLHFLTGLDPGPIAVSPFTPQSLFGEELYTREIGLILPESCRLFLPRSVCAYVGADITCCMAACAMPEKEGAHFLVDIGTNGEMALCVNHEIFCCSTAAGPAFEGAKIKNGMTARQGAVSRVFLEGGGIQYHVIGGVRPAGVCGSGIVDAVAVMLEAGVLDETGVICEEGHTFERYITECDGQPAFWIGDSGVLLTQADIRQIQLAKAAVAAGIDTLLNECNIPVGALDSFSIAGGFGSYIDKQSAARIGLIPAGALDKVRVIGNAAGAGACGILVSKKWRERSERAARAAREVSLSQSAYFMQRYVERMMFEEG